VVSPLKPECEPCESPQSAHKRQRMPLSTSRHDMVFDGIASRDNPM
jgi:hypothetical protein